MSRRPIGWLDSARGARRRTWASPRIEALEGRQLLAIFTVTSSADDGDGSLRQAILSANATAEQDTITFAIPGSGVHTIRPETPLPTIAAPLLVDGNTQGSTASGPLIQLDGSLIATAGVNGLTLNADADSSTIRGLAINNFTGAGIQVTGASNLRFTNNFLGTDPAGTEARPNGTGLRLDGASNVTIGGLNVGERNLISGNTGPGIRIAGSGTNQVAIQGNQIGTTLGGNAALGNGIGVELAGDGSADSGVRNVTVGGSTSVQRNVISGNVGAGLRIADAGTSNNRVEGNYIGTNASGTAAVGNGTGVQLAAGAANNTLGGTAAAFRNVISGNAAVGVEIVGASNNLVAANYIGTNADGSAGLGGGGTAGILIRDGATNNSIGGSFGGTGNVVSGLVGPGIWVRGRTVADGAVASTNLIQGNFLGTNPAGTAAISNAHGIVVSEGAINTNIGGTADANRNVISGNREDGIRLGGPDTTDTLIQGNAIGVANDLVSALPNAGHGVQIDGASETTVGGTAAGAGNTIAHNAQAGVRILSGVDNLIRRNVFFSNGGLGIDLGPQGVTPNDPLDPDEGPNRLQNFPVLTAVETLGGTTVIRGTLNSRPNHTYIIEFYSTTTPDASGHGEGRAFIGQTTVTTGTDGNATFSFTASQAVPLDAFVTSIAIEQVSASRQTNTSEFSENVRNTVPAADVAVTQTVASPTTTTPNLVAAGGQLLYTLTVTNNGPARAAGVTLTDTLPPGVTFVGATASQGSIATATNATVTVNLGDLAAGTSATVTITLAAPAASPTPPTLTNVVTVSVGGGQSDPNPDNNRSELVTNVVQGIDLDLTQQGSPSGANVGDQVAFLVTLTNNSSRTANNVVLTNTLPANFEYLGASSTQGTISGADGVLTINLGDVPPVAAGAGFSARITIVGRATAAGNLTNTATVAATQPGTLPGANASSHTVVVTTASPNPAPDQPGSGAAPQVVNVQRLGRDLQRSRIQLFFSEPLDVAAAQNLANYRLVTPGRDARFGTRDDRAIRLASATYDAAGRSVMLVAARPYSSHLLTQLTVSGGLTGTGGQPLAGGDFIVRIWGDRVVGVGPVATPAHGGIGRGPRAASAVDAVLGDDPSLGRFRRPSAWN